jgi:hypothetical protein
MQRWIEVALPLTLITLFLGYWGYRYENWRQGVDVQVRKDTHIATLGQPGPKSI